MTPAGHKEARKQVLIGMSWVAFAAGVAAWSFLTPPMAIFGLVIYMGGLIYGNAVMRRATSSGLAAHCIGVTVNAMIALLMMFRLDPGPIKTILVVGYGFACLLSLEYALRTARPMR